jgi:two-component system response regulator YesN
MAYTVVIVEDEQIIREDLEKTTPWESLDLVCIGSASDGLEGERMIKTLAPDMVITDIRLPGQDGLAMLRQCQVAHAIILSGHSDFSYMQAAIRLGVYDYLLKPVDDGELEKSLASLVDALREEDRELAELKQTQQDDQSSIYLPRNVGNHMVESAIVYINDHFNESMGLLETAQFLQISESHLSRLFKEVTGWNFLHYLNAWRVNQAIELLEDPRLNIAMISNRCGFPTPGYFAKIFRRFTGKTPSQYRDEHSMVCFDGKNR